MPAVRLGFLSGGTNLLSGNFFSGQGQFKPTGGVQLKMDKNNSGNVYVALSGGVTVGSGVFQQSGFTGRMEGVQLNPGDPYFVPKSAFQTSGSPTIFCQPDANCSGQAVVYFEPY